MTGNGNMEMPVHNGGDDECQMKPMIYYIISFMDYAYSLITSYRGLQIPRSRLENKSTINIRTRTAGRKSSKYKSDIRPKQYGLQLASTLI